MTKRALFCEIDGRVLGGMQFGSPFKCFFGMLVLVLFEVLVTMRRFVLDGGSAVWGAVPGVLLEVLCNRWQVFRSLRSMRVMFFQGHLPHSFQGSFFSGNHQPPRGNGSGF